MSLKKGWKVGIKIKIYQPKHVTSIPFRSQKGLLESNCFVYLLEKDLSSEKLIFSCGGGQLSVSKKVHFHVCGVVIAHLVQVWNYLTPLCLYHSLWVFSFLTLNAFRCIGLNSIKVVYIAQVNFPFCVCYFTYVMNLCLEKTLCREFLSIYSVIRMYIYHVN